MTPEENERVQALGAKCRARGCTCLAQCWHAFNGLKYWVVKAEVCTHPNWALAWKCDTKGRMA